MSGERLEKYRVRVPAYFVETFFQGDKAWNANSGWHQTVVVSQRLKAIRLSKRK
jgi:hypothetical protein